MRNTLIPHGGLLDHPLRHCPDSLLQTKGTGAISSLLWLIIRQNR